MSQGAIHGLTSAFSHGRAFSETLKGTSPAAGAGYSLTVSGAYAERFMACRFQLVTSATSANRIVTVDYVNPGAGIFASAGPTAIQTASLTNMYCGTQGFGASDWNTGTAAFFNLPNIILLPGFQLQINVAAIDTTDQLSAITFLRERFQTGREGFPLGFLEESEWAEQYETIGR